MRPIMTQLYLITKINAILMRLKFDQQLHKAILMDIKQAMHACNLSLSFKAIKR